MNPQLRDVHNNIARLGLNALAIANYHAHYAHMNETSGLAVLSAAHAAELLIKARIAQEHPLLIFEQLPKTSKSKDQLLDFDDLFENGRALDFADLPARLWAATGITVPNLQRYRDFGRLRNAIQHFASPKSLGDEVDLFIFEVIDPFINACWGLYAVDYNEDTEIDYLMEAIVRREILFLMSPRAGQAWERCLDHVRHHGPIDQSSPYFVEMNRRAKAAIELARKAERAGKARRRRLRKKHEADFSEDKATTQTRHKTRVKKRKPSNAVAKRS